MKIVIITSLLVCLNLSIFASVTDNCACKLINQDAKVAMQINSATPTQASTLSSTTHQNLLSSVKKDKPILVAGFWSFVGKVFFRVFSPNTDDDDADDADGVRG